MKTLQLFKGTRTEARKIAEQLEPKYEEKMNQAWYIYNQFMQEHEKERLENPEQYHETWIKLFSIHQAYHELFFACMKLTWEHTRRNMKLENRVDGAVETLQKYDLTVF